MMPIDYSSRYSTLILINVRSICHWQFVCLCVSVSVCYVCLCAMGLLWNGQYSVIIGTSLLSRSPAPSSSLIPPSTPPTYQFWLNVVFITSESSLLCQKQYHSIFSFMLSLNLPHSTVCQKKQPPSLTCLFVHITQVWSAGRLSRRQYQLYFFFILPAYFQQSPLVCSTTTTRRAK